MFHQVIATKYLPYRICLLTFSPICSILIS